MKEFIRKYEDRIHGVLSCFDRMLFRGYLPITSGWAMAQFLDRHEWLARKLECVRAGKAFFTVRIMKRIVLSPSHEAATTIYRRRKGSNNRVEIAPPGIKSKTEPDSTAAGISNLPECRSAGESICPASANGAPYGHRFRAA